MDLETLERTCRALMASGLDGDPAAHKALLELLGDRLRGYFRGLLRRSNLSLEEAEDLVQETLITIHIKRHTYDRSLPVTPWVFAIARRRHIDHWRRTRGSARLTVDLRIEDLAVPSDAADADATLDLEALLARLPPRTREAVRWLKLEGHSVAEVSSRTGTTPGALKVSVHRALKSLGTWVGRDKS